MFHAQGGWFWKRNEDGSVSFEKRAPARFEGTYQLVASGTIEAGVWASIVATVSARGETSDTWREALEFHNNKQDQNTN